MNWLQENWFWILVVIFFVWMHKGHGGHGHGGRGHGAHGGRSAHGKHSGGGCRSDADADVEGRTEEETT